MTDLCTGCGMCGAAFCECQRARPPSEPPAPSLAARVAELEAQNADLRQGLADALRDSTMLTDMAMRHGGDMTLGLEGGACQLLAESFAEQFLTHGSINYLEVTMQSRVKMPGERLVVTIQRCAGKTPHQLRGEAEAELQRLRAAESEPLTPKDC